VIAAMRDHLARRAPLGRVDYVEIVDPATLQRVEEVTAPALIAAAVKFSQARLIDNLRVDSPGRQP
jgi:pantoate--beta-alanine ligase